MKTWTIMLAAAFILFLTSAESSRSWGPETGSAAPNFRVQNAFNEIEGNSLRGKTLLVKFWSASDPQSRVDNKRYQTFAAKHPEKLAYVAICTDADTTLASQILKIDRLPASNQYFAEAGRNNQAVEAFSSEGNQAFLIGPDGKVTEKNPAPESLEKL